MDLPPTLSFFTLVRHRWKSFLVLTLCIMAVYGRTVRYDFVTYDDYELVFQNEAYLSNLSNIGNAFTTHAFTTHRTESGYYRPLLLLSYIIDYQLWQLRPFGYHFTNIVLHCCSALLLLLLLELLLGNGLAALGGSLLFALHPVQTESVAWIAGRNDVLLGLFIILAILMYTFHLRDGGRKGAYYRLSMASFALALFTKESGAFYLLLFPLMEMTMKRTTFRSLISMEYARSVFPFAIVMAGYLVARTVAIGTVIGAEKLYGNISLAQRFLNIPAIVSEHLKFIVLPIGYSVVHPFDQLIWLQEPWSMVSWLLLAALFVCVWRAYSLAGSLRFGLVWFVIGLLPLLGVFPLAVSILEHRLYLPLAGLAIVAGSVSERLMNSAVRRQFVSVMFGIVIALCGVLSILRLPVWQDSESMWRDAIDKAPTASRSYFNLAGYFFERGEYDKTIDLMKKYVELRPDDITGNSKLHQTLIMTGRYDEAAQIRRNLVRLYRQTGDTTKAGELSRLENPRK